MACLTSKMDSSTVWIALPAIAAIIVLCTSVVAAAMEAAVGAQGMGQVVTGPGQDVVVRAATEVVAAEVVAAVVAAVEVVAAVVDSDNATAT